MNSGQFHEDYVDKTSALIDAGVHALRNWEVEMDSSGGRGREGHHGQRDPHFSTTPSLPPHHHQYPSRRSKKTSQAAPPPPPSFPQPKVSPRVIISQFEKYMENKRRGRMIAPSPRLIPKRVKFYPQHLQILEPAGGTRVKASPLPGLLLGHPPSPSNHLPGIAAPAAPFFEKNYRYEPPVKATIPSQPGPDGANWWRRKIRQGMIETELLMSELVKQRREDEKYFNIVSPFMEALDSYNNSNFLRPGGRSSFHERERLEQSLEDSKQVHAECFGSCPVPSKSRPQIRVPSQVPSLKSQREERGGWGPRPSLINPTSAALSSSAARTELSISAVGKNEHNNPKPQHLPKFKDENVKILFERTNALLAPKYPAAAAEPTVLAPLFLRNPITPLKKFALNMQMQQNFTRHKGRGGNEKKKGKKKKEWMQDVAEAKKVHEVKVAVEKKKRAEKDAKARQHMYDELTSGAERVRAEMKHQREEMKADWRKGGERDDQSDDTSYRRRNVPKIRSKSPNSRKGGLEVELPRWKESPKGLSAWLENVLDEANEHKMSILPNHF